MTNGKPPYRVPSMREIAALPWNGLTVASTFAGAGGSSLGYRMAGYRVAWANEFVPVAQESYRANMRAGTILDGRDIKTVTAAEILRAIDMKAGELDVFDGSPPCQAFSTAGQRDRGWGKDRKYAHGAEQRNEDLFAEFIRLRDGLRPRCFVAENVSGLVKGKAKGFFLEILAALRVGYRVEARVVDAQWLGVPQQRERVIFVGVREDLGLDPAFPSPLPYRYSIREAVPWLLAVGGIRNTGYGANRLHPSSGPSPTIMANGGGRMNTYQFGVKVAKINSGDVVGDDVAPTIEGYAIADEYAKLNPGQSSEKFFSLVRPDGDEPCPTVTASGGGHGGGAPGGVATVCHPTELRKFTILELKRLCGFPDDFDLRGTYADRWARLGNSVPPVMMRHVAEVLRDRVLIPARRKARTRGRARR